MLFAPATIFFYFQSRFQDFFILVRMVINMMTLCTFQFDQIVLRHKLIVNNNQIPSYQLFFI